MNETTGQPPRSSAPRTGEPRGKSSKAVAAEQARAIRRYLSAVESTRPGRGTKRTTDAIGNRITKIDEMLVSADPLTRVHLTQERIELHAEQVRLSNGSQPPLAQLERDFIRVVRSYGDRNGISFAAWRQVGVDTKVLDRAGIHKAEKKPPPAVVRAAAEEAAGGKIEPAPEARATETHAPLAAEEVAGDTSQPEPVAAANGVGEPGSADPPTLPKPPETEVSLEELASLLTDVASGAAPAASDEPSQPALGDQLLPQPHLGASPPSRKPRPAAEE